MKKRTKKRTTPTRGKLTIFAQLCNHIPGHLVAKLARETGVESMARTFSAWSHVVAMLYAQLFESIVTPASVRICRISVSLVATNRRSSA